MSTDVGSETSSPRWARALGRVRRRRRPETATTEASETQWAPPYDSEDISLSARTPEPWPPLPPPPPAQVASDGAARAEDPAQPSGRRSHRRRLVAIGTGVAVLSTWFAIAVFFPAAGNKTNTAGTVDNLTQGNGQFRRGTVGVIQSTLGATLTLQDRRNQILMVNTTRSTIFTKTITASVGSVKKGDAIVAFGVFSEANTTFTAGQIAIEPPGAAPPGAGSAPGAVMRVAGGTVTEVTGDTLTVSEPDGSVVTVAASPSTTVTLTGEASLRDMTPGRSVLVQGMIDADGSLNAARVQEVDGGLGGFLGGGFGGGFGGGGFGRYPGGGNSQSPG